MSRLQVILIALLILAIPAGAAYSQETEIARKSVSFGARIGYGTNPDQFAVGFQSILGKPASFIRFCPSLDLGFGDNLTTYSVNGDLRFFELSPPGTRVSFYGSAGPTITLWNPEVGKSDTEIGISIVGGLLMPIGTTSRYNLEFRIGFGDVPEFRILFGIFL